MNNFKQMIYPNAYDNRIWHSSSLKGCTGFVRGEIEWGVVDDDGGICIALCPTKNYADEIAKRLNGNPQENRRL